MKAPRIAVRLADGASPNFWAALVVSVVIFILVVGAGALA